MTMDTMNNQEENERKIADYLEDRMDAEEEERFMQEIGENGEIRRQYEEMLVVQTLLNSSGAVVERRLPIVRYRMAAVLAGLIIGGTTIFLLVRQNGRQSVPPQVLETLSRKGNGFAEDLFREFYSPWTSTGIPSGAIVWYNEYRQGNFFAVLSVSSANYPNADKDLTVAYLKLLQGLSALALDRREEAIGALQQAMQSDHAEVHDAAAWYAALAFLRNDQPAKAIDLLKHLTGTSSLYDSRASRLLGRLSAG